MRSARRSAALVALMIECLKPSTTDASIGFSSPLWSEVGQAATIVVAEIAEVTPFAPRRKSGEVWHIGPGRVRATLNVKETWKGKAQATITLDLPREYAQDLVHSGAGGTVVAFFWPEDHPVSIAGGDGLGVRVYPSDSRISPGGERSSRLAFLSPSWLSGKGRRTMVTPAGSRRTRR